MKKNSISARRWLATIWILSLCCWSAGCGRRVVYVNGGHRVIRLEQGQPAPERGVWMSEEYLSEIHEALGARAQTEDSR